MDRRFRAERAELRGKVDGVLLVATMLLVGVGIVALFAASQAVSLRKYGDEWRIVVRQIAFLAPGAALAFLASRMDIERARRFVPALTLGSLLAMLLPFLPVIGSPLKGASRWIDLGLTTFQPSELAKLASIIYVSHVLALREDRLESSSAPAVAPFLMLAAFAGITVLQNDLSTALLILASSIAVMWVSPVRLRFFAALGLSALPFVALMVLSSDYRLERVLSFIYPAYDSSGAGYQMSASLEAIREGGALGVGLGMGAFTSSAIPEVEADFVFAAFVRDMGFIGVVLFLGILAAFAARGFRAALASADSFMRYLGTGICFLLVLQSLVNVSVVAGLMPATGLPLPFFSAGGSSLVLSLVSAGILLNISRESAAIHTEEALHG
jgi:cell division protein FtsW